MTDNAAEIVRLEALLRAREGKPGYAANVEAIKAQIAKLKEAAPADG